MQLAPLCTVLLLASAGPSAACSIALGLGGTLALSADATRLGSGEPGGVPKTLSILNLTLGAVEITVQPPTLPTYPVGFNIGSASVQVSYSGGGLLSGASQPYTSSQTSFDVPALLSVAALLTLNNRVLSPSGFTSGTYQTRTVLTCS